MNVFINIYIYIILYIYLLGQWLNFQLFGITYLVGKIKSNFYFRVHWLSEYLYIYTYIHLLQLYFTEFSFD